MFAVRAARATQPPRDPRATSRPTAPGHSGVMAQRRFRILLHPFFFLAEEWNGIDEHLLLLAKYLDRERFELLVLVHETDGPQTRLLAERAGIRTIDAPYQPGASTITRLRALRKLYASECVDVVHFHSPAVGGQTVAGLAAKLAGVSATVATYHQIQPWRPSIKGRAVNYLTHLALVNRTMAVSSGVRESLVTATGLPRHRIFVVHNGIDEATAASVPAPLPRRASGEIRIGYFGRLSPEKGLPDLIEGIALLGGRFPSLRTVIVGDGPERAALEMLAKRLGIEDRIRFLGFRADARQIMAQVDIVAHVPVYEGFGIVVLEAMAAGRPVVVNDAPGGVSEIVVDGETGLIVPAGSADVLAGALARLLDDAPERERLGRNGRARQQQRFSASGMVEQIMAVYARSLRRRHTYGPGTTAPGPASVSNSRPVLN
jgi:glycosyltransferase involved in cell wall biosynthesis